MSRRSRTNQPPNPRQLLLKELQGLLKDASAAMARETDPLLVTDDQIETVFVLAKRTAKILSTYKVSRALVMDIYGFLISQTFPTRYNASGDDEILRGLMVAFNRHIRFISVKTADRIPVNEAPVKDPLSGESKSGIDVRIGLAAFLISVGRTVEADAFSVAA